ncbi:P43 5S RNA-binding protein-like isoform X2 [Eleginops maclovinus]|uniref:P43 5S RNA-binding protein-like isoform X2 n=1 Tax=Eleginops maclovinus TaxID=56733 RepID=UPI0030808155
MHRSVGELWCIWMRMYMSICGMRKRRDGEAERDVSAVRRTRGTAGPSLIPSSPLLPLPGRDETGRLLLLRWTAEQESKRGQAINHPFISSLHGQGDERGGRSITSHLWKRVHISKKMNGLPTGKDVGSPPPQLFNCAHADCGATFTRQWKLKQHETVHTGASPCLCTIAGCGHRFTRKSHLSRHMLRHRGVKQFQCKLASCTQSFFHADKLKRHIRYAHGDKDKYFKCSQPNCSLTFKKRRLFKLHLKEHGVPANLKCSKAGCAATFDSHIERKAHEKRHAGYCCPHNCELFEHMWSKLQKHISAKHQATFTCQVCKKEFAKADALRRHKRTHASHKPVLVCPRDNCQAYFSTTFNLQHHIRKVHLQLLKYRCSFPDCPRKFAMRESVTRHLLCHDPDATTLKKRLRPKKSWQKRVNGHHLPLVEENLHNLFALRMRISRRAKVETNLQGLFNERKIPHYVDPEVNLRKLFGIKQPYIFEEKPELAPLKV